MSNVAFISCIRFFTQLLITESAFVFFYPRKKYFGMRFLVSVLCSLLILFGVFSFLKTISGKRLWGQMLYYLSVFGMSLAVLKSCFDVSEKDILFAGIGGYTVQHLAFSVMMVLWHPLHEYISRKMVFSFLIWIPCILFSFLIWRFGICRHRKELELKNKDVRMMALASVTLFITVVLSLLPKGGSSFAGMVCRIYSTLCCVLILALLFYIPKENKLYHEREMLERMIQVMGEQQQLSKESVELINRKCHDIKHQLKGLMTLEDEDKRKQYVEEIREAISLYDAVYQTGNVALDFLLREKNFLFQEYEIKCSCVADGEALQFMDTLDIYALFGNALDNAVESVKKEKDVEKRIINIHIVKKQQILYICIENYCGEQIQFENELPISEKADKDYHGFGVKSICHIAEKYGGDAIFQKKQDRFQLDILLPIP